MTYNTDIFKNYIEDAEDSNYLKVHKANQESYKDSFRRLLPADKNSKILEIGCGAGQLLYYLKSNGYINIEGIDIGEAQIKLVKGMGIAAYVISSIPDFLNDKKNRYDLIMMNQVIEHFSKDELWSNLRSIHGSLKTGGTLIVVTPNMACASGPFQRYVDFTHEVGFTERSAHQVMRTAVFKGIVITGDKIKFYMRPQRILWWLLNRLWTGTLGFIYYLEKGMDRPKVLSRNLIVVCKK